MSGSRLPVPGAVAGRAVPAAVCGTAGHQRSAANSFERSLRNDLYAHLQSLPAAFHDRWHSGQLLSRAMADLSVIRRFVGFGLVFLIVNSVTFVLVIVLLFRAPGELRAVAGPFRHLNEEWAESLG